MKSRGNEHIHKQPSSAPGRAAVGWRADSLAGEGTAAARQLADRFGYSSERRLERQLAAGYAQMIDAILPRLDAQRLPALLELASLPELIRGYGHVKLAGVEKAKACERELLAVL